MIYNDSVFSLRFLNNSCSPLQHHQLSKSRLSKQQGAEINKQLGRSNSTRMTESNPHTGLLGYERSKAGRHRKWDIHGHSKTITI
ncbi:hypothetical protein CEXT_357631 [Caerostris extrusa]|uniref:Uncharacterized protein n=1 Tax=Caerostris extrusa TaxID=172846 RepID=A0AAV4NS38_CAEEX|nr:hypothetical protein CEXT_357631 [Caerostris extrusa]